MTKTAKQNFGGKNVVITGGASGIGRAIAEAFSSQDASVAILDLNLDLAREVSSKLGSNSIAVACDVSKIESINQAVSHVIQNFGKIDILVNSAGIAALNPA